MTGHFTDIVRFTWNKETFLNPFFVIGHESDFQHPSYRNVGTAMASLILSFVLIYLHGRVNAIVPHDHDDLFNWLDLLHNAVFVVKQHVVSYVHLARTRAAWRYRHFYLAVGRWL